MQQIEQIATHLPYLTDFYVKLFESESDADTENKIFSMFSIFPKL